MEFCYECGILLNFNNIYGYTTKKGIHYCSNCYEVEIN